VEDFSGMMTYVIALVGGHGTAQLRCCSKHHFAYLGVGVTLEHSSLSMLFSLSGRTAFIA
ncbi:hypothetical protein Q2358_25315, partial [Escherichia coli]|uniref:hypothetical protein n=1 Tax=Pseudomonas aeruginosa TaxID=287 RepID=UPI0019D36351